MYAIRSYYAIRLGLEEDGLARVPEAREDLRALIVVQNLLDP